MKKKSFKEIWRIPLYVGVCVLFGLLAALLGTGIWYWLSWAAMIFPLGLAVWKIRQEYGRSRKTS